MTKATNKEEVTGQVMTKEEVITKECSDEIGKVLKKYNRGINIEMVYGQQAIVPRVVLIDTTPVTYDKEKTDEPKKD